MGLMRRVKRHYDPGGLLNPGIKLPEPGTAEVGIA
jgi:FAD/FMN-containing dehydrogenase